MASTLTAVFRDLNPQQTDGMSCIVCNAPFHVPPVIEHVPVGVAPQGGQVFACEAMCAPAVGYRPPVGEQLPLGTDCAPGCVAPADGVHTSCPGPLVGQTVESVR